MFQLCCNSQGLMWQVCRDLVEKCCLDCYCVFTLVPRHLCLLYFYFQILIFGTFFVRCIFFYLGSVVLSGS